MRNHTLLDFLQVESQRGRIFKTVGLRWIPIGKMFTDSTTKVDNEPLNGSNEDITNPYKCEQTLNVSAGTLILSLGTSFNPLKERLGCLLNKKTDISYFRSSKNSNQMNIASKEERLKQNAQVDGIRILLVRNQNFAKKEDSVRFRALYSCKEEKSSYIDHSH
ncbi:hypothetical protein Tco_1056827 [Tanacetum coccineum]|uniref:Uncharacterized protein n=1 Tax=Tanacetum coccineum TaxID=301880 RepID=A0ABQ5H548_9ASTR